MLGHSHCCFPKKKLDGKWAFSKSQVTSFGLPAFHIGVPELTPQLFSMEFGSSFLLIHTLEATDHGSSTWVPTSMWETQIEFQAPGCLALLYGYLGIRPSGRKSLCLCLCFCFSNKINKIKSVIVSKRERTWWKPIDTESRYCLFRGQEVFKSWIGLFFPQKML